ncbi:hypothetical protein V6N13_049568 [Hibiscus sabdariffa]
MAAAKLIGNLGQLLQCLLQFGICRRRFFLPTPIRHLQEAIFSNCRNPSRSASAGGESAASHGFTLPAGGDFFQLLDISPAVNGDQNRCNELKKSCLAVGENAGIRVMQG